MNISSHYNTIIIGAGAAGLMCAAEAGKNGNKVLLVDHNSFVGRKIKISGGGICNFTNLHKSSDNFLSKNPYFCISALKRYTPNDFVNLVKKYNISYHEKTLGQLFCDGSSEQIIDMLISECRLANVDLRLNSKVLGVEKNLDGFIVLIADQYFQTKSLVIATGGLSIPKIGATNFGYKIAQQFGINIIPTRAALVPFTLDSKTIEKLRTLSGVAAYVTTSCNGKSFQEALLFTHRGISGPAILQISSYWQESDIVHIDLAPQKDIIHDLMNLRTINPKQAVKTYLCNIVAKSLANYICDQYGYITKIADLSNKDIDNISSNIHNWQIIPSGTEGYRTAEVTIGGIDTNEISAKTFESKKVKGLYFIGEVVDVTGHLGGFNFQWAWSSAVAAGRSL